MPLLCDKDIEVKGEKGVLCRHFESSLLWEVICFGMAASHPRST